MFSEFIEILSFAFGVTAPIFLTVSVGMLLKKLNIIDNVFADKASKLVFMVALPVLLFTSIVKTNLSEVLNPQLLALCASATVFIFILLWGFAHFFIKNSRDRGVFVQGSFRGNLAIVGLALCVNAYGEKGLAAASILMSVLTLFYNVLSVYILNVSLSNGNQSAKHILLSILKNPLVIAIILGISVNALNVPIHSVAMQTGEYLSQMTLPLALLCIGASLSLSELRSPSWVAIGAVTAKLIVTPIIILAVVYWWGFRGLDLGVVFLMVSTPSAAAGYIMVQAMNGNAKLAANIVVVSTMVSIFTVSIGLALLRSWQVI